ncbi:hypothetical protein [Trichloromonas sp.]|uniref:hypothetical protein n=1 Tax=Trichloromonas sp. TaxID=3069249 RepID=UPI002A4DA595|nr:hypothetical protein [Trichloromonas sp.]
MEGLAKLTIEIDNSKPVELIELSQSFQSFADEYRRYLLRKEEQAIADDIKLYIKEIRSGSIIADLVALSAIALPFVENSNTIIGFGDYLKKAFDYLTGKSENKPNLEKANYENLARIIEPIAKDNASQINCSTIVNGNLVVNVHLDSPAANAAQNVANREIRALKEPTTGLKEKVLLHWYQARNDAKSTTGDKAIIESIQKGPVKAIFAHAGIKAKMLLDAENPFIHAYVVDVVVETINDRPALYKIIDVHEKIDIPAEGSQT